MITAIEFARPGALVLLVLPIAVLWLARHAARPDPDATGTLEIWRRSAGVAPRAATRERRAIPPALWWLAGALVLGVVALAGPRPRSASDQSTLTIVVDRSPSMYLTAGGSTRLEQALAAARDEIARFTPERITWIAPPQDTALDRHGHDIPDAWRRAPRTPRGEVEFAAFDRPATLWITDRVPSKAPAAAGYCASGGARVPGPIGARGTALVDWDGEHLVERVTPASARRVTVSAAVPEPIARVARTWAAARGYECSVTASGDTDDGAAALALSTRAGDPTVGVDAGRDGWTARGTYARGPIAADDGPLERWLVDPTGLDTLVASGPGRVLVALQSLEAPRGDPAAFAVSWSQLFDACVLEPAGCVSMLEREDAGNPARRSSASVSADVDARAGSWPAVAAVLSVVAALGALVAAGAGRRASLDPLR